MTFDGCIGDVEMDGKPIGLFNFRQLVQAHNCRGCIAVYVTVSVLFFLIAYLYVQFCIVVTKDATLILQFTMEMDSTEI